MRIEFSSCPGRGLLLLALPLFLQAQLVPSPAPPRGQDAVSRVWAADNGDGTYKNPILYADYSDPDAIRVGEDYYMTASSFNETPGLPILHSKDMVNWKLVNYAIQDVLPKEHFSVPRRGDAVWAPSIRFHKGEFYIYW